MSICTCTEDWGACPACNAAMDADERRQDPVLSYQEWVADGWSPAAADEEGRAR